MVVIQTTAMLKRSHPNLHLELSKSETTKPAVVVKSPHPPPLPPPLPLPGCEKHRNNEDCRCQVVFKACKGRTTSLTLLLSWILNVDWELSLVSSDQLLVTLALFSVLGIECLQGQKYFTVYFKFGPVIDDTGIILYFITLRE